MAKGVLTRNKAVTISSLTALIIVLMAALATACSGEASSGTGNRSHPRQELLDTIDRMNRRDRQSSERKSRSCKGP